MYKASEKRYANAHFRKCGNSGLYLPAISLGLWHNFGKVDDAQVYKKILYTAFDHGITHFDLANNYGHPPGSAESNFGKILAKDFISHRDEMIISTKAGYRMWPGPYGEWGSRKYLLSSLDQSLHRLKLNYVDIFYSHRYDPNTPLEETMNALATAVHSGKALYAGISNYGPQETLEAINILKDFNVPLLIHQPKYSLLARTPEEGLLQVLNEHSIGCIAFSPLAQGLLTDKYLHGIPKKSRAAKPHGFLQEKDINQDVLLTTQRLNQLALQRGQSLAQMAVAWLLSKNEITSVLVGASSSKQLLEILKANENIEFSQMELQEINDIISVK
jgi:L-glyceraldehyde 3-phosphate reductase